LTPLNLCHFKKIYSILRTPAFDFFMQGFLEEFIASIPTKSFDYIIPVIGPFA